MYLVQKPLIINGFAFLGHQNISNESSLKVAYSVTYLLAYLSEVPIQNTNRRLIRTFIQGMPGRETIFGYLLIHHGMKINNSMAILFWPVKRKKDVSGKAPIYCRITIDGKRTELSTGIRIDPSKWSAKSGKASGVSQEVKNLNEDLEIFKGNLRCIYNQLQATNTFVTGDMVRNAFTGEGKEKKTVMDIFTFFNALLKKKVDQQLISWRHWRKFEGIKSNIAAYLRKEHLRDDIYLRDLKSIFAEEFYHYLILEWRLYLNICVGGF